MKTKFTGIFRLYFCVLLLFGITQSLDSPDELPRIERAILGGSSGSQDVVGGGSPGKDFPALSAIPRSDFPCGGLTPGYYADEEYGCQVFHICQADRGKDTFLCPNGTIFDQKKLVCDWWFNVDCSTSRLHVSVNEEIGKVPPSRSSKQSPTPPRTSFTSISGFTQSQRRTTTSVTIQPTTERIQTLQHFSGDGFGIPLDTFSNLGDQDIGRNLEDVQDVRVSKRPVIERPRQRKPSVSSIPERGVSLQSVTDKFDSSRRTSFQSSRNQIRGEVNVVSGVPLSTISEKERTPSVQNIPDHFTVPKPSLKVDGRGSRGRVSHGRRVTINKRPLEAAEISSLPGNNLGGTRTASRDSKPLTIQQAVRPASRSRTPVRSNVVTQDQQIRTFDIAAQDVAILDDKKVSTQFFNIGRPRTVPSRLPTSSNRGRPLPVNNLQPGSRTVSAINNALLNNVGRPLVSTIINEADRSTGGRVLPATNIQPGLSRSQIGRPLPAANGQPDFSRGQAGRPLPATNVRPALSRSQIGRSRPSTNVQPAISRNQLGRPLPPINVQPALSRNQIGRPLPPANIQTNTIANTPRRNNNIIRNQQPRVTANRGSARFRTSERNRGRINRVINGRNRSPRIQVITRPVTTRVTHPVGFIRDFDDDDLDDLNDPFDDDRFDLDDRFDDDRFDDLDDRFDDDRFDKPDLDDRFDDDRFDLDDRFDDDRFDKPDLDDIFDDDRFDDDRFDLDDRFDDDRFDKPDLDDRFDDDRFDLDDRFDDDRFDLDDRFDDDRFDLDDRFDDDRFDLDDRFDRDRFDFDDEIFDDRRERFDNDDNFNFGRIARGSTFIEADDTKPSEEKDPKISIEPPSEIQLPPPPR